MIEVRCPKCNKLACMATQQSTLSIKCSRNSCNEIFEFKPKEKVSLS